MSDTNLTQPEPALQAPHQPGVTDPVWPLSAPAGVNASVYEQSYAGQLERQRHLHIVTADLVARSRAELGHALHKLTDFARHQMTKKPPAPARLLDPIVVSRRVSVTMGFGAPLFTTREGDDRFGIAALRPNGLKMIPQVDGDVGFKPAEVATSLIFCIYSNAKAKDLGTIWYS